MKKRGFDGRQFSLAADKVAFDWEVVRAIGEFIRAISHDEPSEPSARQRDALEHFAAKLPEPRLWKSVLIHFWWLDYLDDEESLNACAKEFGDADLGALLDLSVDCGLLWIMQVDTMAFDDEDEAAAYVAASGRPNLN